MPTILLQNRMRVVGVVRSRLLKAATVIVMEDNVFAFVENDIGDTLKLFCMFGDNKRWLIGLCTKIQICTNKNCFAQKSAFAQKS